MWQRIMRPNQSYTFGDAATVGTAQNYCVTLSLGGHDDWRVPNIIEIISIVDTGSNSPCVDLSAFPSNPQATGKGFDYLRSATRNVAITAMAWAIAIRRRWET